MRPPAFRYRVVAEADMGGGRAAVCLTESFAGDLQKQICVVMHLASAALRTSQLQTRSAQLCCHYCLHRP